MAEGKQEDDWNHTAKLIAEMHGLWGDGSNAKPSDFHPFLIRRQQQEEPIQGDITMLKAAFAAPKG